LKSKRSENNRNSYAPRTKFATLSAEKPYPCLVNRIRQGENETSSDHKAPDK
jgi:hypothetical protein